MRHEAKQVLLVLYTDDKESRRWEEERRDHRGIGTPRPHNARDMGTGGRGGGGGGGGKSLAL